ncbi:MAG TPA: 2-oxoglutarate dehydrogenase E1 component [Paraburkholderia sp.]|uniref:2-oxoglutarate dehydrogenase E1 component n=1 Tax=Paraburkholderia sp. TaxID=1926495 RepID=UPI002B482BFE|nr:2-oxoglutarate dehydrogenase E1 component [Paraburkholderia sp.]HKR45663.1 2-oxoglutarate dehydrogenase E1 component [Paraburkholderia sp.]
MSNDYSEQIAVHKSSIQQGPTGAQALLSLQIERFIDAHRREGYRSADLDPLALAPRVAIPELSPQFYGLDPAEVRPADQAGFPFALNLAELDHQLKRVYCGALGIDCSGMRNESRRRWLFNRTEAELVCPLPTPQERDALLRRLLAAEMWERLVASRHEHAKRFSLEGCESLVPLLDALIDSSAIDGVQQIFLGMPHRGRLNALVNVMDFPIEKMLACLDHHSDTAAVQTDLPYHLGGTSLKQTPHGEVALLLAHNPSHLQSVYPVVSGMARAWQDDHPDAACVPVVVHGDAAFAGQGIVMETLNLTRKSGYMLGGTIHVIVNNQIGFTTPNLMDVHDSAYCTDIARMIDAPVIHVNADHPEDVIRAARIAFDYRMKHEADVVIDLIGYRRLGHSEHDIPAITQPLVQKVIAVHSTVTERYHAAIGAAVPLDDLRADALRVLQEQPAEANTPVRAPGTPGNAATTPYQPVCLERIHSLTTAVTRVPDGFRLHEFITRLIAKWQLTATSLSHVADWCFAENIAYASLLEEGRSVRLSGMDVGRGTFMHRHAVWHAQDAHTAVENVHIPLKYIADNQGAFDIINSPLTEEAVLGFEYGYSVQTKKRLTIWEAQFGDFVNSAQVIIDQFIAAGEYKWGYQSALTVLLPHGHEGVGPEHSNGYLGRFLQLCADDNLRVVVPSTSAQWFHMLRAQASANQTRPLVVMSPKTQLHANPASHSPLEDFVDGSFESILSDPGVDPCIVTRVVLCSGKLFYDLQKARDESQDVSTAIVRIEQLYPFPHNALGSLLSGFERLAEVVWAQEEDRNQGAWRFVREELERVVPANCGLRDVCRNSTASGAHSSISAHRREQCRLVASALFD